MRSDSIIILLFILIISAGLNSCKEPSPIVEKKFIKIYADMIFMQDTSSLSRPAIKEKVLQKFKVSENDYNNTIKFYNDDPVKWQSFFDSVIVYIEKVRPIPKKTDLKSLPKRSLTEDKKDL